MKSTLIVYFFTLLIGTLTMIYNTHMVRRFEERAVRQNIITALDAASDAATEFLLWESHITNTGQIFIDPDLVWEIYKYTFLNAIGLHSARNMELIEASFPLGIIAVNDGYFMRLRTLERTPLYTPIFHPGTTTVIGHQRIPGQYAEEWVYGFTQKIPFARVPTEPTRTTGSVPDLIGASPPPGVAATQWFQASDLGTANAAPIGPNVNPVIPASSTQFPVIIADTMNGQNLVGYFPFHQNGVNAANFGGAQGRYIRFQMDGSSAQPVRGSGHYPPYIARELLRAMDYSMTWNASINSRFRSGGQMLIPTEMVTTFGASNVSLVGPMVMAILDDFSWLGYADMDFWTISNTQIVDARSVFVYRRIINGVPTLVYSLCNPEGNDPNIQHPQQPLQPVAASRYIVQIFSTQQEAAVLGAYPDLLFADICA